MKQLKLCWQVGRFLRLRMRLANETVYTVARKLGVKPAFVLQVIAGASMPKFADIELVASAIDTDVQAVLIAGWAMTDAWELEKGRFGL